MAAGNVEFVLLRMLKSHYRYLDHKIEMTDKWDPDTETYDYDIGACPYCNCALYLNDELSIRNYNTVKTKDNEIIWICYACTRDLQSRREITSIFVNEEGSRYSYEFVH